VAKPSVGLPTLTQSPPWSRPAQVATSTKVAGTPTPPLPAFQPVLFPHWPCAAFISSLCPLQSPSSPDPDFPCSDSDEQDSTKEDNSALLSFHLKYEADILFTRWALRT
jgi:hypothetical protein